MATMVSPAAGTSSSNFKPKGGVAPLRAGTGSEFFWRRLHSLTGIIPVGAFLFEHILISNSTVTKGPVAYSHTVQFLANLPFVTLLEAFGIWIPLAFHGLYGFWIWYRGVPNLVSYSWAGNWMYSLQRWTGGIAWFYILYHVITKRFMGVDLHDNPGASFGKMQESLQHEWILAFYILGLVCASWHFGYGIWLFCAKWGIVIGERARKGLLVLCLGFAFLMMGVGVRSLFAFRDWPQQPVDEQGAKQIQHSLEEVPKGSK